VTERLGNAPALVLEAPADDPFEWVEPELGLGDDAEVAAPSAKPPEQLGVLIVARAHDLPARADHLRGDQVVAGESILGGQVTDPATEGETRDARGADYAAGRDQAVCLSRGVEVEPSGAALASCHPVLAIDTDVPHAREIDHQAVVDRAVAGGVVASAPDRDLEISVLSEGEGRRNIAPVDAAGDRRRAPIDQQVEAEARPLVLAVAFDQHVARQRITELIQRLSHRS